MKKPEDVLGEVMGNMGIEHYGVLSYSDCRESAPEIRERHGIEPKSAIVYLLPYYTGETENISRYAASLDYHLILREVNERLISSLRELFPNNRLVGYGDHSPIDERSAAVALGLGFWGKNGLFICEEYGSYVFIGDVLTDIEPELLGTRTPTPARGCIACGKCLDACPTGILSGKGEDCLSAITQKKGDLTEREASLIRDNGTVWGCDACQSVCPYNMNPKKTPIAFFYRERIGKLDSEALAKMDKEAFSKRAFAWRGRRVVERNLKIYEEK